MILLWLSLLARNSGSTFYQLHMDISGWKSARSPFTHHMRVCLFSAVSKAISANTFLLKLGFNILSTVDSGLQSTCLPFTHHMRVCLFSAFIKSVSAHNFRAVLFWRSLFGGNWGTTRSGEPHWGTSRMKVFMMNLLCGLIFCPQHSQSTLFSIFHLWHDSPE